MENRCYKCDFYYNGVCNHYAEPSTTDDDKCRWFKEKSASDVDAYRAAVKALVDAARAVVKEYDPEFAVRNAWDDLHVAIAAVERLK